jgi:hypothetical protein
MTAQAELAREQARACRHLGSQMYGELLDRLADDLAVGGGTAGVLRGHESDRGPSALSLRLLGAVHRAVLSGRAPELERFYPTTGGRWSSAGSEAVLAFLGAHGEALRPLLEQAPQTNEVGRAAALMGGLLRLVAERPLPVRLFEIGASGGLNLQADRFRFEGESESWGDPASPVVLDRAWTGSSLAVAPELRVVERGGCDVSPVDVSTEDGRLTLASYVWPDQTARHARLAGAIALARSRPVHIERCDAAAYVERLETAPGTLTVLWHSVVWQYVPQEQRSRVRARLAELGRRASVEAPLVHLYAEPIRRTADDDHRFWVCAERWPGSGERVFLGRMAAHGVPVDWL